MPRPKKKKKNQIEYDETAHKIAYCKRQIYFFTNKPNVRPRIAGYYQEELKELENDKRKANE